ncbi:hypothetical protein [Marivita geojedonensis]|uniref:Uncharacterized protein n=1 Tax=Marivita geojedonensis TaxID=1123756 RepID=A0A1X4NRA3_9RHOB|nr:hypothetical protein [Marivita geojedonensis]OSQ53495.1 hypothetical protein MGEO_02900 [Marivita geojedonensis]PRY81505.1 hypothetical protein CLV76_10144 [Marivita geojedonensis]
MKSPFLAAMMALTVSATGAFAQSNAEALAIAQAQEACGEGQNDLIVSARFLEDGRVGVRCAEGVAGAQCIPVAATGASESERRAYEIARSQNACGDRAIISARFETNSEIRVQCSAAAAVVGTCPPGTVAAGGAAAGAVVAGSFTPTVVGGVAALLLGAAAMGNSTATSDTQ